MSAKDKFDLEKKFEHYLQLIKLDVSQISRAQYVETKRAFYGGLGMMFKLMTEDVAGLREMDAVNVINFVDIELMKFWTNEAIDFTAPLN